MESLNLQQLVDHQTLTSQYPQEQSAYFKCILQIVAQLDDSLVK